MLSPQNKTSSVHAMFVSVLYTCNCVRTQRHPELMLPWKRQQNSKKDNFRSALSGKFAQVFPIKLTMQKSTYVQRENERSRKNIQKTKDENKKLKALRDFVSTKYKNILNEFEQEYAASNSATETTANTAPLPTAAIPPFQHLPPRSETLNGMNVLYDLDTISQLDLGDINLNLFGDPYLNNP
jgi:hypothetical protein